MYTVVIYLNTILLETYKEGYMPVKAGSHNVWNLLNDLNAEENLRTVVT